MPCRVISHRERWHGVGLGGAPFRVRPSAKGYRLLDVVSVTDATAADQMTWDVTDLGFRMGLSNRVPDVLDAHVGPLVAVEPDTAAGRRR